jgi:hypothetical protein
MTIFSLSLKKSKETVSGLGCRFMKNKEGGPFRGMLPTVQTTVGKWMYEACRGENRLFFIAYSLLYLEIEPDVIF